MSRDKTLSQLITRYLGKDEAKKYHEYALENVDPLGEAAKIILSTFPDTIGLCASLSAAWTAYLQDKYEIPAITVAGDLKIGKVKVFKSKTNVPSSVKSGKSKNKVWDGHCWIEIDGLIGDLSIFRTAYSISYPSVLKEFVIRKFGSGKGVLVSSHKDLEEKGMKYIPRYVLNEHQINPLIRGLEQFRR